MSASIRDPAEEIPHAGAGEAPAFEHVRASVPVKIVRDLRLLLIAIWLGAAVFFSFGVAPGVFAVLPTRELAGAVVSRTLGIINTGGFGIGLLLLATVVPFKSVVSRRAFFAETISLVLIALSTYVGKWVIASQMQTLRAAMGRPIDEVATGDPLRIAFNSLHSYSVAALSIAMVAAIVSLLLIARRAGK